MDVYGVPRLYVVEEDGFAYFCEDDFFLKLFCLADEYASGLGHSFDAEGLRHDGIAGEVVVEMLFGQGDILYCNSTLAAVKLEKFVYPNPSHAGSRLLVFSPGQDPGLDLSSTTSRTRLRDQLQQVSQGSWSAIRLLAICEFSLDVIYNHTDGKQIA